MALVELSLDKISKLTLSDPSSRNAMSETMAGEFFAAVERIKSSALPRVLILTGAGEAFSGGGHLSMLEAKTKLSEEENRLKMLDFYRAFLSLVELDIPVIAAINGHAIGAGACLTLASDIRIISKDAKLGFNFVSLGLHPGMGASHFLPELIGYARASELLYSGSVITADVAASINLVNQVVPAAELISRVEDLAGKIAGNGPKAIRALKKNLNIELRTKLKAALEREAIAQASDYIGEEFLEGIRAAKEKRQAQF
jgi:enoyl-CoA hydratase/carnithine racemase